ncbi:hypothetical protein IU449_11980 [Nocardia higoensis]|uniref:Uncharacterized protein n=1 Tax=Nocardia higoensis TaxID=228599 RepID=A0ABS0D9X1_9NOCA|nr:hypothetical protein [Nocardia higoensis]MBF6355252.1 hypothetical protein [Nocardia higoensis]
MTHAEYYHYFGSQLKIETRDDGAQQGSVLDWKTGHFVEAERGIVAEARANMTSADIWRMTFEEFVSETERARATFVSGEGSGVPSLSDRQGHIRSRAARKSKAHSRGN